MPYKSFISITELQIACVNFDNLYDKCERKLEKSLYRVEYLTLHTHNLPLNKVNKAMKYPLKFAQIYK